MPLLCLFVSIPYFILYNIYILFHEFYFKVWTRPIFGSRAKRRRNQCKLWKCTYKGNDNEKANEQSMYLLVPLIALCTFYILHCILYIIPRIFYSIPSILYSKFYIVYFVFLSYIMHSTNTNNSEEFAIGWNISFFVCFLSICLI